jgi:hypothetical protein
LAPLRRVHIYNLLPYTRSCPLFCVSIRPICRSIFLTEDSTLRRGRRAGCFSARDPGSLHHMPFGSARTARGLRALDLAGGSAPRAAARRAPWGARKRHRSGWANDTRLAPPACSEPPERAGMDTGPAQRQPCGPGGHVPHMHRILLGEIRWRPPKRGFSCSSPPDTRRSRPAHPAESPKRRGGGRRAQHDHTFHYEGRCLPPPPPKPHGPRFGTSRGAWASLGGALE